MNKCRLYVFCLICLIFAALGYPGMNFPSFAAEGGGEHKSGDSKRPRKEGSGDKAGPADSSSKDLSISGSLEEPRAWVPSLRFESSPGSSQLPYNPTQWHLNATAILERLGDKIHSAAHVRSETNTALAGLDFIFEDSPVVHYPIPFIFLSGSASQSDGIKQLDISGFRGALHSLETVSMTLQDGEEKILILNKKGEIEGEEVMSSSFPQAGVGPHKEGLSQGAAVVQAASAPPEDGPFIFKSILDFWPNPAGSSATGFNYADYRAWLLENLYYSTHEIKDLKSKEQGHAREFLDPANPHSLVTFNNEYLHSEEVILSYLSQNVDQIVAMIIKKNPGKKLKNMALNISSYLDICPHCATTLFHNSSLRATFIKDLTQKLHEKGVTVEENIKLINIVSSGHEFMHSRSHKPDSKGSVPRNSFDKLPSWVIQISSDDLKKLLKNPAFSKRT